MKFRSTWILIIVCAMVTAYYFLFEHRREEKGGQPTMESETVLPYNREDVESIVLINPAGERIALERDGEEWMIVHPTRTPASGRRVASDERIGGEQGSAQGDTRDVLCAFGATPPRLLP